jgi:hypothetical protein
VWRGESGTVESWSPTRSEGRAVGGDAALFAYSPNVEEAAVFSEVPTQAPHSLGPITET